MSITFTRGSCHSSGFVVLEDSYVLALIDNNLVSAMSKLISLLKKPFSCHCERSATISPLIKSIG